MITNLCYKLMENCQSSSLRPQQKKTLKDHVCHILGIMIKKYNHSYGACVMIIQTLPHYEHLSTLYADLIQTCVTQLGYESILPDILREFRHTIQSGGTTSNNNAGANRDNQKENPNNKFYSQFLIDLVDRLAAHLLPYLSLIQDFLDDESYLMRNSILYIYGELIVKVLNQAATNSDLKLKQMRNELLDTLMEHVHDSNALTRSRTLQIWRRIAEEKAIPLHYINELMKRCIGRMEDVASSVRKSAFQLLCDLIRKNPYGIKCIEMSHEEIKTELEKEEAALNKVSSL
jgi:condensin complex subunit 1